MVADVNVRENDQHPSILILFTQETQADHRESLFFSFSLGHFTFS